MLAGVSRQLQNAKMLRGVSRRAQIETKIRAPLNKGVLGSTTFCNKSRHQHHKVNTAGSHALSMQRLTARHGAQSGIPEKMKVNPPGHRSICKEATVSHNNKQPQNRSRGLFLFSSVKSSSLYLRGVKSRQQFIPGHFSQKAGYNRTVGPDERCTQLHVVLKVCFPAHPHLCLQLKFIQLSSKGIIYEQICPLEWLVLFWLYRVPLMRLCWDRLSESRYLFFCFSGAVALKLQIPKK